jgi:molybdopterin synthase sulfur carrier subunit
MARVFIPAQWRDLTGGIVDVDVEGATLSEIVAALDARFPGVAERASTEGDIMPGLAASIDGVVTSRGLMARVQPTSEIHFLPAIGGG